MTECVIVGGGLIGMLTAKELVEAGVAVTVIDKGEIGREASWAGGGILSPLYPWRYVDSITRLAQWSQAYYPALCQQLLCETGIDPQLTCSGLLMLDVDDHAEAMAWAARFAYSVEDVTAQAIMSSDPYLAQEGWGKHNLLMPTIGQVRNPRILAALRRWLEQNGVTIYEQQAVLSLLAEEGRVIGVQTALGVLESNHVVVAGGAWSSAIVSTLDIEINIFPVQGQMLLFEAEVGMLKHIVMKDGFYLIPRRDGYILAGSTVEHCGFDKQPTAAAFQQLRKSAFALLPDLEKYPVVKHWAGLRPGSENGVPYISAVPSIQGLYLNSGHFRNGVVMGPASARLLADLLLKRDVILDAQPYSLREEPY